MVMGMSTYRILTKGLLAIMMSVLIGTSPAVLMAIQDESGIASKEIHRMSLAELQDKFYKAEINKEISVDFESISLGEALGQISREVGLKLTYRGDIMTDKKVSLQREEISASDALAFVLDGTGLDYKFSQDGYLLIVQKEVIQNELIVQETVQGRVTDSETNEALPGVNIIIEGTDTGTTTDFDGNFELSVSDLQQTLIVSYIGYAQQVVDLDGRTQLEILLIPDIIAGEELVVVGYGIQRRVDVTGAIDIVEPEILERTSASNPLAALQGQMPGAYVTTSGAPGASVGVIVRGLSTLGNNAPLVIIDGMPTKSGLDNLDADNIRNIQVLKDAAASSIYGSRASNGVIIIETKHGTQNELTFTSRMTSQYYRGAIDVLNTEQRGQAMWQAFINEGNDPNSHALYDFDWHYDANGNPVLDNVRPIEWINQEMGIRAADTDWYDEVLRRGLILQNQLSMSTGGEAGGARLSMIHHTNEGVFINDTYNKVNISLNSNYRINDQIEVGENLIFSTSTRYPDNVRGGALSTQSIIPVYTEDGNWGGPYGAGFEDWLQPVANSYLNSWNNTSSWGLLGSAYAAINFTENLEFRSTIGIENNSSTWTQYNRPYVSGFLQREISNLTINKTDTFNWNLSNVINYGIQIRDHSDAGIVLGTELYRNKDQWINTFASDFAADERNYYQMDSAVGSQNVSGNESEHSLLSFFGRINYNYMDKYLLQVTLRYDGSSRFGSEHRFGTFPSFSAGWRLDQESFIKDNFEFFDLFRLRYGYGVVGNQEIGNYAALGIYEALYGQDYTWDWAESTSYDIAGRGSGNLPSGYRRVQLGNPNLKWETTTEHNAGLEFGFLDMALTGSFDYYIRESRDILIQPPYLAAIGEGGDRWYNGATVENRGWEFSLKYMNFTRSLGYEISANFGHFKDKITHLPESVIRAYPGNAEQNILGRSQTALFGYVADGLFQNQAEVDAHAEQSGKGIGRIRYADLNGDGVINSLDQKYQGNTLPSLIYGVNSNLNYKNWNLNIFFNGELGKKVYNSTKQYTDFVFTRAGVNYGKRVLDAWTPQNNESTIPALITSNVNNEFRSSSYFIENGGYLKLRSVELSYNIDTSANLLRYFRSLRVFVFAENVATIKHRSYTGPDPENPNNSYARPLNLTLGVNFSI
jgi:TonB-linked SusC/RagA family outer membrane protein